ncbi:MAG TPA: hypothetical protein VLI90_10515, partial [Tepidisphaeraceae bacterium]|nr:hypothetical protein [Tepidisphaeraceae bacterium]
MLQYHNDLRSTGQNLNETAITYATLNASQFAKQFATPVDGQVFAQPLYMPQLSIVGGPQPGVHDVVFAATEHGSVYAIDAAGGNVLWRTSLIDVANPRVNLLGATTIAPVPSDETHSGDLTPEISITATPVIDPAAGALFVAAKTKQSIAGADHYAQTLFKLDIHSGAVVAGSTFADTKMQGGRFTYRYGDDPFVRGTGAGAVKDPKDTAGESRVYFNALREFGRSALVLDHGRLTECFASHGDNGPYHGWVLQFDPTSLAVVAALNVSPNGDGDGIWQSGAPPAVDERGDLFLEVGNGTFDGNADAAGKTIGLDDAGFPKDGDYGDCFLRITIDPDHPSNDNQNRNGWGLKVADYFSPFNNHALDRRDTDVGSGGVLLLPDAVGADAHRHLLVGAGKEGKIYLLDRDDLGKFDPATDHAVQTLGRSRDSGINASFGVPALFNGSIYYFPGYGGDGRVFHLENGGATLAATCTSRTADRFGALIGTPSISADGRVNGVVWILDRGSNQLRAYRADDLNVRLWSSGDAPHDRDRLGMVTKFSVPTIADGRAFVGTADHLVVYGPPRPPTSAPPPPSAVVAEARAFNLVAIHWQDNASNEDGFHVERSTDGSTWTTVATVSSNETTATDPSTLAQTAYEYRVSAFNGFNGGSSATSTEESKVTTPAAP